MQKPMQKQDAVLNRYKQLYPENTTFKLIAAHTGIQLTRVFRLFNAAEMRLQEFSVFENLIQEAEGGDYTFHGLLDDCQKYLSKKSIEKIKSDIHRKLILKQFKSVSKNPFKSPDTVA